MADLQVNCLRSLWQTLVAAASTFALFAAANWGMAGLIGDGIADEIWSHIALAFLTPLVPLMVSIWNALKVWMVKSRLGADELKLMDHRSIAIITLCPIFIQIPSSFANDHQMPESQSYRVRKSQEEFEDSVCPLELQPADKLQGGAGMTMVNTVTVHDDDAAQDSSHANDEWVCFQLPRTNGLFHSADELVFRAVLLSMSLAPKYKKLSFVRARNTFQTVVTALQAGGCVLSLLQRLLQHLGVSPVEAITTFLSIMVILQLLIELYACGNYQRPLLLRLDAHQFVHFRDAPRIRFQGRIRRQTECMAIISLLLVWMLISIPALYYFSHYVHTHIISGISSFIFFLSQALLPIALILEMVESVDVNDNAAFTLLFCSMLLFAGNNVVAIVATIVEWKAFHDRSLNKWFTWIIPHVSS